MYKILQGTEEDIIILSVQEALSCLKVQDDQVHCFLSGGPVLVGTDWDIKDVQDTFHKSVIQIGGKQCYEMGHGIVAFDGERNNFFEHDEEKLMELIRGG